MWCGVVTLFPDMFLALTDFGISSRAVKQRLLELEYWNPRDFAKDKHRTVDDSPYGGGPGMVMMAEPLYEALRSAKEKAPKAKTIYVSPQGKPLNHQAIARLALEEKLIFLAGRYEGVDERVLDLCVDEEWSLGDYVLSGGELAVMVVIDAITRLLPGALGNEDSNTEDSFVSGLLDCPHFTRPPLFEGLSVPRVLLSGDHAAIEKWRYKQQLGRTFVRRPDLLQNVRLSEQDQVLIQEFIEEKAK